MVGFDLHIIIYLLLVCFVVFALVLINMPNFVCVSGLPIFLYRLLGILFFDA